MDKPKGFDDVQLVAFIAAQIKDAVDSNGTRNPAAMALGRLGGLKGGKGRARKLSPERRKQIARLAAVTRWENRDK